MTQNTDNKERKIVNTLEAGGIDEKGKDAYIFVHLTGLQDFLPNCTEDTITRWFNGVRDAVWSSFTAAGQPIRFAYFHVLMPESLFEDFSETLDHDTLGVTECEEEMEDWARGSTSNEQIVVALVSDIGTPRYYAKLEVHNNIVASHHLHYTRAAPVDMEMFPEKETTEYIFIYDPDEWYYEIFDLKKPSLKKRKLERLERETSHEEGRIRRKRRQRG